MRKKTTPDKLYRQVRRIVLEKAASESPHSTRVALSWLVRKVAGDSHEFPQVRKRLRGKIQHILSQLTQERIMLTRRHCEGGIGWYNRGLCDKIFKIHITQEDARALLAKEADKGTR